MLAPPLIAVLDDEAKMRTALRRLLQIHGYRVELFDSAARLIDTPADPGFDCLILDLHMPDLDGFEVLAALAGRDHAPPVVVITGHDQPGYEERVSRLGASAYLTKPCDESTLLHAIGEAIGASPVPSEPVD